MWGIGIGQSVAIGKIFDCRCSLLMTFRDKHWLKHFMSFRYGVIRVGMSRRLIIGSIIRVCLNPGGPINTKYR